MNATLPPGNPGDVHPEPPVHHVPLSRLLGELLNTGTANQPLTLNQLLGRTEGRGVFLVIVTICIPFMLPMGLMGLSTPMGLLIVILALRHALDLPPRLLARIGDRPLPDGFKNHVLGGGVRWLGRLERWVKPRRDRWLSTRPSIWVHCMMISVLAILLCLPLPPFIPFTNTVPAIAIILLSLSMMEEDGVLIWFGYLAVLGNAAYFAALVFSVGKILMYWKGVWEMVQSKL